MRVKSPTSRVSLFFSTLALLILILVVSSQDSAIDGIEFVLCVDDQRTSIFFLQVRQDLKRRFFQVDVHLSSRSFLSQLTDLGTQDNRRMIPLRSSQGSIGQLTKFNSVVKRKV